MSFESWESRLGAEKWAAVEEFIRSAGPEQSAADLATLIAGRFGVAISRRSVMQHRKRLQGGAVATVAPAAPIHSSILLRENAALKRQLHEREAGWAIIREVLEDVYATPLNIQIAEPKVSELPGSPETAVLHVTDVHYGKVTPTYDVATCEARMLQVFNATSEITELRRRVAPIDEILVLFGGDMIEGEGIFPHQAWETEVDLIEQMVKGGPQYAVNLLLSLLQIYPRVRVRAAPGNHGRQGKFMSPRNNADSVFYEIVRTLIQIASPEAAARIEWDLPLDRERGDQWYSRFNIVGRWEGMLVHGDQIKGQLGFPWYGYGKKVNGWRNAKGTRGFTHLWAGHFHTHATFDLNDATVLSTGSPESSNGYALENMAAAGDPKQRLSFFNERYGMIFDSPIYLN